jgi:hypothetical protein
MTGPSTSTTAERPLGGNLSSVQRLAVLASVAVGLAAVVVITADTIDAVRTGSLPAAEVATLGLTGVWVAGLTLVGAVLAFRRPENRVSWLFVGLAPLLGSVLVGWSSRVTPPADLAYATAWLGVVSSFVAIALAGPVLALVFPDGRLPSRRWRRPAAAATALFLVCLVLNASAPGQLRELGSLGGAQGVADDAGLPALAPMTETLSMGLFAGLLGLGGLGIAAIVARRRNGGPVVRAQLAWFLLGVVLIVLGIATSIVESSLNAAGTATVGPVLLFLGFALTPIAVGIAILRYRLFDIDLVVRRTVTYAVVASLLAGIYVGSVVVLQAFVVAVTGGQNLVVAASTLLVAAAFQPLRRRVRAAVDRRFYRTRANPRDVADRLTTRLRDQVELDAVATDLLRLTRDALQPSHAGVWIRRPAAER